MSKKQPRQLSQDREKAVLSEIVDMYIENGGIMPSQRQIKKNRYISEEEVSILRTSKKLSEWQIRKMATEKTGQKFISSNERRKQKRQEEAKRRMEERERQKQEEITKAASELAAMSKTEPEDKAEEHAPINEPKNEEASKMNMREEIRKGKRYTPEECEELFGAACRQVRHILTQTEIREDPNLPSYNTLQRQIGPWYEWDKKFGVKFANPRAQKAADVAKAKAAEDKEARDAAKERFDQKVAAGEVIPTESKRPSDVEPDAAEPMENVTGIKTVPEEESDRAFESEPQPAKKKNNEDKKFVNEESSPDVNVISGEMIEIPFKLIIPKGIKGTLSLYLSI
ncbi:hypothetical protein IJ798_02690 [Candidatus Saccharibacteria bacterium]|nr:hypothetical protein [Candidatus Saccharibacteria bacterium]